MYKEPNMRLCCWLFCASALRVFCTPGKFGLVQIHHSEFGPVVTTSTRLLRAEVHTPWSSSCPKAAAYGLVASTQDQEAVSRSLARR